MKIPLSWLREMVNFNQSADKIAELLLLSGTKVEEFKKINNEIVFDFEITPNRGDQFSVLGIARELAVVLRKELKFPDCELLVAQQPREKASLKSLQKTLCPAYSIVKLTGAKINPSSKWIQNYLNLSGIRAVNNVVDVTNLIMVELGQPMHAFDSKKIKGSLNLRASRKGEKITTLDGIERTLPANSIIIEDEEKLVDLAGLMGGKNSEISENTSEITLLVPVYSSLNIRRTSQALGVRTEASTRFEKNIDPNIHPQAIARATQLLIEETTAALKTQICSYGYPVNQDSLVFDTKLVKKILGLELSTEEIFNILAPLGFQPKVSTIDETNLEIKIPSWRADISIAEDILEEIGRIYGYNKFPKNLPGGKLPLQPEIFKADNEALIRGKLLAEGFTETTGFSLVSEVDLQKIGFNVSAALKVLHPTSSDFTYLRPSLAISLLKAVALNSTYDNVNFFEIGKVFNFTKELSNKLPQQPELITFVSTESYWQAKLMVDTLAEIFGCKFSYSLSKNNMFKKGIEIFAGKQSLGSLGQISEPVAKNFEIDKPVWLGSLDLAFFNSLVPKSNYQKMPIFPAIKEDFSLFVPEGVLGDSLVGELRQKFLLISKAEIFDLIVRDGKKSIGLRLEFSDRKRTLQEKDAQVARAKVLKFLKAKFKAEVRS